MKGRSLKNEKKFETFELFSRFRNMIGAMLSGIAFATENEDDIEHVCVYSCETGETQVMRIDDFIAQNRSKNGKSAQIASDEVSCPAVPPENGPAWAEQNNQNDGIDPQDILGIGDPWRECDPLYLGCRLQ